MRALRGTETHRGAAFSFPPDDRGDDFANTADVLTVSPLHLSSYSAAATSIVSAAMTAPAQRALLVSCDLAAGGAACARTSLEAFVARAWRRPVTPAQVARPMARVPLATGHRHSPETAFTP